MSNLDSWAIEFDKIGWFIPPYVTMGQLGEILKNNNNQHANLSQTELEEILSRIYSRDNMANLIVEKYLETPFVKDYVKIIENGIEAHFLGMHFAAVSTLIPLIEGIARKLADKRGVGHKHIKQVIRNLCESCKIEVTTGQLGAYDEVASMIDSFEKFAVDKLYSNSSVFPHDDNTNRNGITHAAYSDSDYGTALNFYKSIAAINLLCFLSAIDAKMTWFPPKGSEAGQKKSDYYLQCEKFSALHHS